jgi:hypothetical protein
MKWLKWFAVAIPLVICAYADLSSSFSDFDFTVQPKTLGKESKVVGDKQKQDANWAYDVTADNKSTRDYADVEFQYILFRKQALIGNKSGASRMVRKTGSVKAPAIAAHGRFTFTTESIMIEKTQLAPGWHYRNGANPRDYDSLQGIWIRVLAGGKQIGEYTSPADLGNREKWDAPSTP